MHIRYRQIFSGGGEYRTKMKIWLDENEKLVGKFFAILWRAKKGFPKGMGTKQSTKHKLEENQYYYSEDPI